MKIEPISHNTIHLAAICCLSDPLLEDSSFEQEHSNNKQWIQEGVKYKEEWLKIHLDKYGEVGYLAFDQDKPIGLLQFLPDPSKRILFVQCIFIPEEKYRRLGLGKQLLQRLIEDSKQPKVYFENNPPDALVTYAFEVPGFYPQDKFFKKNGFLEFDVSDPYYLYYPLKEDIQIPSSFYRYTPTPEDLHSALVLFDTYCPFCVFFVETYKKTFQKNWKDLELKILDPLRDQQEYSLRGTVPFCSIKGKAVKAFILESESFINEVNSILELSK